MGSVSTLPVNVVNEWRASAVKSNGNGHHVPVIPKKPGSLRVAALISCPRLAWTDTFGCAQDVFMPLGIGIARDSGAFWGKGLTRLLEEAVRQEIDIAITLDYDSVFTREHVLKLIKLMVENPEADAIVPVQVRRENNSSMFTIRGEDGVLLQSVSSEIFARPLTKIATGHFGLTAIRIGSLEKLIKPWLVAIPDANGEWSEQAIDEDIYFWLNAEVSKWNVYLANEVRIGHIQNVVTWPKQDFKPMFQYVNDFNKGGQPAWQ